MLTKIRYKLVYNRSHRLNRLGDEHLVNGWLTRKMSKTGFMVDIPVSTLFDGKLLKIVEKYGSISKLTKALGSNCAVNRTLRNILDRIGVDPKITFHSSRHTFATLLVQNHTPITTVQKLLGHQKVTTTQIYSEVDRRSIMNDLKKTAKHK